MSPSPMRSRRQPEQERDCLTNDPSMAAAILDLASAIREGTERIGPAVDSIAHLGDAQKRLCDFLVRRRMMIMAAALSAVTAVGAISPNAAALIGAVLTNLGAS